MSSTVTGRPIRSAASVRGSRRGSITYLAAPYSHPDPAERQRRYQAVTAAAAALVAQGQVVFSPITMTHPIDQLLAGAGATMGSDYWAEFDERFMAACSDMLVLTLDGWQDSTGVQREIAWFKAHRRPIRYLDPAATELATKAAA